jgi:DNA-binding Lrp family transcriptional regulator
MKEHKGIRPQDVVILLKIIALGDQKWYNKDIASQLGLSNSEVSESLNRSLVGGLIEKDKKSVRKEALLEFLVYGIKYVFPAIPGRLIRGMPSGYSAPVLSDDFVVDDPHVWPAKGYSTKGIGIEPLYETVPEACAEDSKLYDLLALIDALRIGERNEQVVELLAKKIYDVE